MGSLDQVGLLLLAFGLSSLVGLERQLRQQSAGLRTHTLVGVGAAAFIIVSKYGFADVVSQGTVELDPSRVAAQVVSGIGFLGAGVIFLKRDGVRGLTTAATIWLTAAVGLAAGAGLVWIAVAATAAHMITALVYTPLIRRLPRTRRSTSTVEVAYRDGEGVLRHVLSTTTGLDYLISDLEIARRDQPAGSVSVIYEVEGKRDPDDLVEAIQGLDGVVSVRTAHSI